MKAVEGAALIAGSIAGAILDPGMSALWWDMASMGAGLEIGAIATMLERNDNPVSIRQPAAPWQIIYGQTRVSGTIVYLSTSGSKQDYMNLVIVWAGHEITAVDSIWIGGRRVWLDGQSYNGGPLTGDNAVTSLDGYPTAGNATDATYVDFNGNKYGFYGSPPRVRVYNHLGGATSTNPFASFLTPNDATWDSTCWLNGRAATYLELTYDPTVFTGGIPDIQATVRGKAVYDPRTGTTAYSSNAALCVADVLCDQDYGLGCNFANEIDVAQLISAANSCDEQVSLAAGGTESRYQINGRVTTASAPGDIISSMLSACAGYDSVVGGLHQIYVGVWQGTSGLSFDQTNVIDKPKWAPTRKYRDLSNRVSGTFICPIYPFCNGYSFDYQDNIQTVFNGMFQPTGIPYYAEDALHGYSDGDKVLIADGNKELWKDIQLPWTQSVACAQRIEKITLLRNRYQGVATFPMDLSAYQAIPHDVISVTFPALSWVDKEVEVSSFNFVTTSDATNVSTAPVNSCLLTLNETDSSIYDWDTSEELGISVTASPTIYDNFQVDPPTNLTLESGPETASTNTDGVVIPRILCTWTAPADLFTQSAGSLELWWQVAGSDQWMSSGKISGASEGFFISPCVSGAIYNVQIRSIRNSGAYSPWTEVQDYTCQSQVSTIDSENVIYSGGATVASLQPAQPGSDVTDLQAIAHTGTNQGLVTNSTFMWGLQNWSTGQEGTPLVIAQTSPYILLDAPDSGYGTFSSTAFQMEAGQSYRIYWTANASAPIDGSHVFLRILYGTIYNETITQASAGYVGYDNVILGLAGGETQYTADFTAPDGCAWASLCVYYYSGQADEVAVYQIDAVSYGATGQWGADVTANSGNILLQNPNYLSGDTGWDEQPGWSIVEETGYNGSPYVATYTGSEDSAITNLQQLPIGPGTNLTASCFVYGGDGNGSIYPRINWYDGSGVLITEVPGTSSTSSSPWAQLSVTGIAPADTAYATIDCAVIPTDTVTWYLGGWTAAILPNSLGLVPDGGGRYAAVETGADNTKNHILTTPISWEMSYPEDGSVLTEVTSMSWEVIANDTSDTFNILGGLMWSGSTGADIQILGIVDGEVSSAFGYGFGFSTGSTYQVATYFGSTTGLAPGAHNITIYYYSPNGSTITITYGYGTWGQIQQVSS